MLHREKLPIGTIGVDAIYTPIRKVSYDVENMRVGDRTDYNRLRLTIETDGTLSPRMALEQSIKVMMQQLGFILDMTVEDIFPVRTRLEIPATPAIVEEVPSAESDQDLSDVLKTRIETLELSTRTANALSEASIRTIGGLVKKTEEDLLDVDGLGGKGIEEIKIALATLGVSLKK
jgi:DNA-directed RNA polymerase subunit alpha